MTIATGADLRRLRHSLGLTLDEVSRGICSSAHLSLVEQGQREASERIAELLLGRLRAAESESGVAVQITALKVAEYELRQNGSIRPQTRSVVALKAHEKVLLALEAERASQFGAAIGLLDEWLVHNENSRDLRSFGARLRVRMLRAASRDNEAIQYAARVLAGPDNGIKSRQDDLLEIAFQLASLYGDAGAWADAIRVLEAQTEKLAEPKQVLNAHWSMSDNLYGKGDIDGALLAVTAALDVASTMDIPTTRAKLINNVVWYELLSGRVEPERQRRQLAEIEASMREADNASMVASTLSTRALLEARLGDADAVRELAAQAIGVSVQHGTRTHEELVLSIGEIGMSAGVPALAESALALFDARTREVRPSRAEANLLYRVGCLCERLGDLERANEYYASALKCLGFVSVAP